VISLHTRAGAYEIETVYIALMMARKEKEKTERPIRAAALQEKKP
jgi:hypothetical protein